MLKSHKEWRESYLEDEITEDSLKDHVQKVLINLFKAGVLDNIEVNVTKSRRMTIRLKLIFPSMIFPRR